MNPATRHEDRGRVLSDHAGELVVPAPVVPEAAWMIESRLGPAAEAAFLRRVTARELQVIDLDLPGYQRCIELVETYADLSLGSLMPAWWLSLRVSGSRVSPH